jgi:hypothetical protein
VRLRGASGSRGSRGGRGLRSGVGLGGCRCFRGHGHDDSSLGCNGCRGVYLESEMSWSQLPLL